MIDTLRHGGELNPPLYFTIEWLFGRLWGTGDWSLRVLSAICVSLGSCVLFFTIRPLSGPRLAALALALVLGLSRGVFVFVMQARYYGVLFLLVAVATFYAVRLQSKSRLKWHDYALVFLTHSCMIYVHLYGLLYSGMILAAMMAADWLWAKPRWGLYGSVVAAWAAFAAWLPFTLTQLKSVSAGAWTPPHYHTVGYIIEQMALDAPLGLIFLFLALLTLIALIVVKPCAGTQELEACSAPRAWSALLMLAVALMTFPIVAWLGSFRIVGFFMPRYVFPCTTALVVLAALMLTALHSIPKVQPPLRLAVSARTWSIASFFVLAFCLLFQPVRAWKNAPRSDTPFADSDFGYKNLPIVFEDMYYYLPRAVYGSGRQYLMVTDEEAAKADPGWFTKCMDRYFRAYYPSYGKVHVVHSADLPNEFLAVDDDYAKTFEWIFQHRPDFQIRLLGTRKLDIEEQGQERVFLVRRTASHEEVRAAN
jgi:hypothetical protein